MSEPKSSAKSSPIEILAEWEGPAVPAPGVDFEEQQAGRLSAEGDAAALAAWIALTAVPGVIGNTAHEALKQKARGVLASWRSRFGQAKIDEVKQQLLLQMQQHRRDPKITDEELRERIDQLFLGI